MDGDLRLRGESRRRVDAAMRHAGASAVARCEDLGRRRLVDGGDRRESRHLPELLHRRAGTRRPAVAERRRPAAVRDPVRGAGARRADRPRGFRESVRGAMAGRGGGGEDGALRPRRAGQRDGGKRAARSETVLAAQPPQHHLAEGRLSAAAQPVPRDGVRVRGRAEPRPRWPTHPAPHPCRLGAADRQGHAVPARRGADASDTQRPEVEQ